METDKDLDKYVATVGDLIKYLQDNCNPNDKLCMFYEGGAYVNLERIPKDFIGDRVFIYVKKFKEDNKKILDDDELYNYVKDNDLIIY